MCTAARRGCRRASRARSACRRTAHRDQRPVFMKMRHRMRCRIRTASPRHPRPHDHTGPPVQLITRSLHQNPGRLLHAGFFRDLLAHHLTSEQVTAQPETATYWGRYAERHSYDSEPQETAFTRTMTADPAAGAAPEPVRRRHAHDDIRRVPTERWRNPPHHRSRRISERQCGERPRTREQPLAFGTPVRPFGTRPEPEGGRDERGRADRNRLRRRAERILSARSAGPRGCRCRGCRRRCRRRRHCGPPSPACGSGPRRRRPPAARRGARRARRGR